MNTHARRLMTLLFALAALAAVVVAGSGTAGAISSSGESSGNPGGSTNPSLVSGGAVLQTAASPSSGSLKVLKGGYRATAVDSGDGYADPLAGAIFERSASSTFSSPTSFAATDNLGAATAASLAGGTYYVREKSAPSGWNTLPTLTWNGSDSPYVGDASVNGGTTTAAVDGLGRFVNAAANPPLPTACGAGLKVLLLLDTSGSTSGYNNAYNSAAKTFVSTLGGTATTLKISTFATNSSPSGTVYDLSGAAGQTAANSRIDTIYPSNTSGSGSTNWDAAMQDAASAGVDVIVFVTDGNPTSNKGDTGSGGNTSIEDVTFGVASANLAKYPTKDQAAAHQRILGVGVGADLSIPNLAAVLKGIATNLCSGTVTINKVVVPANDAGTFAMQTDGAQVGAPIGNGGTTGPQKLTVASHTFSETAAAGTLLTDYTSAYSCSDATGVIKSGAGTSFVLAVLADASVTCTFTNTVSQPQLKLVKAVINDNGGTATAADFALSAKAGTGSATRDFTSTTAAPVFHPVYGGVAYTLSEVGVAGYGAGAWVCDGGTQVGSTIAVALHGSVTCTITNDDIAPKLHLRKVVVNDNGGTATVANFTLKADGAGANDISGTSPVDSGAGLKADTFALSETSAAGYTSSAWICTGGSQNGANITLGLGAEATCTITNNDVAPILHLRKVVVNDNGGTATVANFTLKADGTGANDISGTSPVDSGAGLKADTFALSETTVAGYAASAWTCVGGNQSGANVTLAVGGEATCTITNDDIAPKLHLRKVVVNDNGGTATVANFTLKADGGGANDISGTSPVDSGAGLKADTFALSETSGAGYTSSTWVCTGGSQSGASITLGLAGEATCTITNTDIAPLLTLVKTVSNDNGGTATAADFTLSAKARTGSAARDFSSTTATPTAHAIFGGVVYDLSETGPAGYAAGTWNCDGGAQSGASISLLVGKNVTCTIANRDVAPQLIVIKHVINDNGGTLAAKDFTLGVKATNPAPATFVGAESPGTSVSLDAGAYVVSETTAAGYAVSYSAACTGTIAVGDAAPVCTVTNNDIAPVLNLRKTVVNAHGGKASVEDFTLSADGTGANDVKGTSPVDSGAGLQADTWMLEESSLPGYAAGTWVCDGGTQKESQITLGIGEKATCAITNSDVAPQLMVVKHVVNDNGGTLFAKDFAIDASGTNASPTTFPGDEAGTTVTLDAGAFKVSETPAAGYAVTYSGECSGTIAVGDKTPVCTVTNDDIAPVLHLLKVVKNDNGGQATDQEFTLTATGGEDKNVLTGVTPVDSGSKLQADTFTLSETGPDGYAASAWVCDGGLQKGSQVHVGIGDEATCTITNNDIAPILHLRKMVENTHGGAATAADFTLTATGTDGNDVSGTSPVDSGVTLKADTWTLTEDAKVAGYAASKWVCEGGTQEGSQISLAIGGEATCTITNSDIAPQLIVIKHVINDNGGTLGAADFTLDVTGPAATPDSFPGAESPGTTVTLNAGAYSVGEGAVAGYAATYSGDCSGTIAVGDTAPVCTVTNNDIAPQLHLRKTVVNDNGGTAVPADFTLTATGAEGNDVSGTSPVDSGKGLQADTFTLSESGPAGYTAGAWSCDATAQQEQGFVQDGSSLTLGLGEDVTCTIVNNDIAPILQLRKIVVNNNGGTATVASFTLTATGTGGNSLTGVSPVDSGAGLLADTWTLSETGPAGYTASAWTCVGGSQLGSTISVGIGGSAICTITNDDNVPVIAPPVIPAVTPVVAPPVAVRGAARISGPQGCVLGGRAVTRVSGRNIDHVVFIRDGRVVKRTNATGTGLQAFALTTVLQANQVGMHTVVARVYFTSGTTPRTKTLTHRFALCRVSPVTG